MVNWLLPNHECANTPNLGILAAWDSIDDNQDKVSTDEKGESQGNFALSGTACRSLTGHGKSLHTPCFNYMTVYRTIFLGISKGTRI